MENNFQRSVSDSKYATRSPHFQDNEAMRQRATASEGAVRPPSRKGSDSSRNRAQRGKTEEANAEMNVTDDLTSSGGDGGSTQSSDSTSTEEWCTVAHRKNHSQKTESTDSRRSDHRTFDQQPRDKRPFGEGRGGRGGYHDRGNRGRGDRGRGGGGPRGRGRGGRR